MADVHSKEVRSYNMSKVKNKNTRPEMVVRSYLHANGFRYRLHDKLLPGKPDIVLPRYNTVVLIHGCFWHGHAGCRYFVVPKTRTEWWLAKIMRNRLNDSKNLVELQSRGWRVLEVWECMLRRNAREQTLEKLVSALRSSSF